MRTVPRGGQEPAGRPIRLAAWLLAVIALAVTAGGWLPVRADVTVTPRGIRVGEHPFFPVGIYYAPTEKFGQLRRMGFTVTHVWASGGEGTRRVLDESHRVGLRAVVELTEAHLRSNPFLPTIRQFVLASRAHPALLAWYLYDEPDREALGRIQQGFQLIRELDPAHPVLIVHNFPERGGPFVPYLDVFGVDPYPVPNMPLSFVSNQVIRARSVAGAGRPVWAVIQAFAKEVQGRPSRYPTPRELRNMVYQAIVAGASGILYFSYDWQGNLEERAPALWASLGPINHELASLAPALLADGRDDSQARVSSNADVRSLTRESSGQTYVILVNVDPMEARVQVHPPKGGNATVEVLFEARQLKVVDGAFTDTLEPHGVRVYRQ